VIQIPIDAPPLPPAPNLNINNEKDSESENGGDPMELEGADEFEIDEPVAAAQVAGQEPPQKKRRQTRKVTLFIFVERIPNNHKDVVCKCGCLSKDGSARLQYAAATVGHVKIHCAAHHPLLLTQFQSCKNAKGSFHVLEQNIENLNISALANIEKNKKNGSRFFKMVNIGLDHRIKVNLLLTMWSVANGVSRISVNCPIFDTYLKALGTEPALNRHLLEDVYVPAVDKLVIEDLVDDLSSCKSVSLSCDGWRDRARRDWIGVCVYWTSEETNVDLWKLRCVHSDLIYVPGSASANNLETFVLGSVAQYVHSKPLLTSNRF